MREYIQIYSSISSVKTVKAMQMNVQLEGCGLSGRVHVSHVTDEIKEVTCFRHVRAACCIAF